MEGFLFHPAGVILSLLRDKRTPRVRIGFLISLAASLAVVIAAWFLVPVSLFLFDAWISAPQDCPSSCKGYLGHTLAPGQGHPTYIPACQPAELSLGLHETRVKKSERYPLWYKASVRNTSCFALSSVLANGLIEGLTFKVLGPDGIEIPASRPEWNTIIPYSYDRDAFEAMKRDADLHFSASESSSGFPYYYVDIYPGRTVANLPSVVLASMNWLQPHNAHLDLSVQNESMRRVIEPRLRGKTYPRPPPGYAVVDGYFFRKPGRYSIQAEFWAGFRQVQLHPRYEWYQKHVPGVVKNALDRLSFILLLNHIGPGPINYEKHYDLRVRSNPVEFEVTP